MNPIEVACPHQNSDLTNCGATAGQPCYWQEGNIEELYHAERLAIAADMTSGEGITPSKEDFNLAVERSELV